MVALNSELQSLVDELDQHPNATKAMTAAYNATGAEAEDFEYAAVEATWTDAQDPKHTLCRMVGIERENGKARVATVCDYCTEADGTAYTLETSFAKDGKRTERIYDESHIPRRHRQFHANGKLEFEIPYDENGEENGRVTTFGKSGQAIRKREFREGCLTAFGWDIKEDDITVFHHYPAPQGRQTIMKNGVWVESFRKAETPALKVA